MIQHHFSSSSLKTNKREAHYQHSTSTVAMKRKSEVSCISNVSEGGKKRKAYAITLSEEEDRNMKADESNKSNEKKEIQVLKSLGNCDVMENLASYLKNQDLGSLYETCQTAKESIDELSLWRKRALKLAKILGSKKRGLKKRFGCKSEESAHFREHCYSLQETVDSKAMMLRCYLYNVSFRPSLF